MQKWLQDANIPSKIILDSAIGYGYAGVWCISMYYFSRLEAAKTLPFC